MRDDQRTRLSALPDLYADRLTEADRRALTSYRTGGEWALLVDDLVAALAKRRTRVSPFEAAELREILKLVELDTSRADRLDTRQTA